MRKFLISFLSVSILFLTMVTPVSAQAPKEWAGDCVEGGVATIIGFQCLLANIFSVAITVIGLVAFVVFILASFRYMLSGGNTKEVEDARKALTYAVVGIVVALSAFIILNLISAFTGVDNITRFVLSVEP